MRICFITATRAEYGLLKPLMQKIAANSDFQLQIIATGAHLSPEFGLTYKIIEEDGFQINEKVEILLSADTASSIVKTMGVALISISDIFDRLKPDYLVILGDRYEMLAFATAANIFKVPIIHLHGGEITEGAYDDSFRHAISKLSYLHFASTETYRQRIIQLGEHPDRVYNVGAIGVDNIKNITLLGREELEKELGIKFNKFNYQVTFHPETLSDQSPQEQFSELLDAISEQAEAFFIFTKANADTSGRIINKMIDSFVNKNPEKSAAFNSLGTKKFLSVLKVCDAIVGNSSSGIIEAPSLNISTINIGNRQKGRIAAQSVINCNAKVDDIKNAFEIVKQQREQKTELVNPYGDGETAQKIYNIIVKQQKNSLSKTKVFYDLL